MKYVKGIEDRPLKEINTTKIIMVYLRDLNSNEEDDVVAEFKLDYGNFYDRKKMGRITYWAITNNHLVETIALSDADQEPVKE